jgi:lysophospholipase L1-like esterase
MKNILLLFSFFALNYSTAMAQDSASTLLALGDSYTIGEKVREEERFPNQVVSLLSKQNIHFNKPAIVATTGWTTDELMNGIKRANIQGVYTFATLLIGVNNQYRGRSLEEYKVQFLQLLNEAIAFAGGDAKHVIVLSIPDWGATPFAEGNDREKIAAEIDEFNQVNQQESQQRGVNYVEVTSLTREHSDWIAEDGLHPNGEMYSVWAQKIAAIISAEIK